MTDSKYFKYLREKEMFYIVSPEEIEKRYNKLKPIVIYGDSDILTCHQTWKSLLTSGVEDEDNIMVIKGGNVDYYKVKRIYSVSKLIRNKNGEF